jgi:hypothetical protein
MGFIYCKAYFFIQEQGGHFVFHNAPSSSTSVSSLNFWSGGLLLVVSHVYAVPVSFSLIGGVAKIKTAKLRHLILLSRVTY